MNILFFLLGCAVAAKSVFILYEKGHRVNKKFVEFHKHHELGEVKFSKN